MSTAHLKPPLGIPDMGDAACGDRPAIQTARSTRNAAAAEKLRLARTVRGSSIDLITLQAIYLPSIKHAIIPPYVTKYQWVTGIRQTHSDSVRVRQVTARRHGGNEKSYVFVT